jgi:hypothetical protein
MCDVKTNRNGNFDSPDVHAAFAFAPPGKTIHARGGAAQEASRITENETAHNHSHCGDGNGSGVSMEYGGGPSCPT